MQVDIGLSLYNFFDRCLKVLSKEYARRAQGNEILARIEAITLEYEYLPCAPVVLTDVEALANKLTSLGRKHEAVLVLLKAKDQQLIDLAVKFEPHQGEAPADRLMATVRAYMQDDPKGYLHHFGVKTRARMAHEYLTYAHKWYIAAQCLDDKTRNEIEVGLREVEWVHKL